MSLNNMHLEDYVITNSAEGRRERTCLNECPRWLQGSVQDVQGGCKEVCSMTSGPSSTRSKTAYLASPESPPSDKTFNVDQLHREKLQLCAQIGRARVCTSFLVSAPAITIDHDTRYVVYL